MLDQDPGTSGQDPTGQEPSQANAIAPDLPETGQDPEEDEQESPQDMAVLLAELRRARDDAAKYRKERSDLKKQQSDYDQLKDRLQELEDAGKSEEEKLRAKVEKLQAKLAETAQAAAAAQQRATIVRLAADAGVDPEIALLLDPDRLDLDDEAATIKLLKKLAPQKTRQRGGQASDPATGDDKDQKLSEEELLGFYFRPGGRNTKMIFGG